MRRNNMPEYGSEIDANEKDNDEEKKEEWDVTEEGGEKKEKEEEWEPTLESKKTKKKSYEYISINEQGRQRPRNEKLAICVNYYNNVIRPKLEQIPSIKKKIEQGKSIGTRDLGAHGYRMFYHHLTNTGIKIKWNELKEAAGDSININQDKYRHLIWDKNGKKLNKKQKFEKGAEWVRK